MLTELELAERAWKMWRRRLRRAPVEDQPAQSGTAEPPDAARKDRPFLRMAREAWPVIKSVARLIALLHGVD